MSAPWISWPLWDSTTFAYKEKCFKEELESEQFTGIPGYISPSINKDKESQSWNSNYVCLLKGHEIPYAYAQCKFEDFF